MQHLIITGNVGKDPELKQTQGGDDVCSFSVAVRQGFKQDAPTVWYRCSVWGKRGRTIKDNLAKGAKVTVIGELTIGSYQDKPQYDVRVADVDWAPTGERKAAPAQQQSRGGFDDDLNDDFVPF